MIGARKKARRRVGVRRARCVARPSFDACFWSTDKLGANGWLLYGVTGSTTSLSNLSINQIDWLDATNQSLLGIRPNASFGLEQVGSDIYLTFQAVPEPSSLVLLGIGGALAGLAARRRR